MRSFIKNIINKETGAISTLVLFTILMFIVILMGTYIGITTMQKSQLESDLRIQEIYAEELNEIDNIYVQKMGVCKIGEKYYLTLQEAINDVDTNQKKTKIELVKKTETNLSISEGKNIILDIKEYEIIGQIENRGNLTLKGNGTLTYNGDGKTINNYGKCTLEDATVKVGIYNSGELILNGGIVNNDDTTVIRAVGGKITINDGEVNSINGHCIWSTGDTQININNGDLYTTNPTAITCSDTTKVTIEGGTISSDYGETIYMGTGTSIEIVEGNIKSQAQAALSSAGTSLISGGNLYSKTGWTLINNGACTITGGTITSESSYAIYNNSGTCTILENATINGNKYGI